MPTSPLITYPQVTWSTLEALYRLGTHICAEIDKFHSEVVVGLAHSGWMPVVIAQAWWAEFVPPLAQAIADKGTRSAQVRYASPWQETLKPLITGTEDITPDRLDWKFIDRESPAVQAVPVRSRSN